MRRSSWIALVIAAVLVVALGILFRRWSDTAAPAMSPQVVKAIVERGRAAAERKDVGGMMDLFSPNAHVLDIDPERLRPLIEKAMEELGPSHLSLKLNGLTSRSQNGRGYASLDVDIDEKLKGANAHYYHLHLTMTLERVRESRLFGLLPSEEWKITRLDSEPSFEIPPF